MLSFSRFVYDKIIPEDCHSASATFAKDCTRVPSPEALDAVYRRPCSCASIRHHARSSFANSGKFTKFKCKIGRCSTGSMEARARGRLSGAREGRGGRKANRGCERQKDRYRNARRACERERVVGARRVAAARRGRDARTRRGEKSEKLERERSIDR